MSNELHLSKSLYLQEHAENPVHWKQWSQGVLDEAQRKDQLLLISIGYSSCHWCHVMEHESFEDGEVAELMNTHYTSIKIDREERPDLDARYMSAVQLMTGQGGWPLNVIALPDGTPVWGGTYFSKTDWSAALEQIAQLWRKDPETVLSYGTKMQEGLKELVTVHQNSVANTFTATDLEDVLVPWMQSWDPNWGGNNRAPKFPMPTNYQYLLQYGIVTDQSAVLDYVHRTLERMSYGGLYDCVHGGFKRYATDRFWKVPHFEKMLYDNGQLLHLFALAQRHRPSEHYAQILRQTWSFLQQHMALPCGLFGAALDADSPTPESSREEGGFYTWTKQELVAQKLWDQELFREYFDLGVNSAWEGKYILHRPLSDEEFCSKFELSAAALKALKTQWFDALEKSSNAREQSHPKPALDPKAIVSWNALLVSGLAQAHWVLPGEGFDRAAAQLLEQLWALTYTDQGLRHQYIDQASGEGYLDDYSTLGLALLDLFSVQSDAKYLERALTLAQDILELFPAAKGMAFRPYGRGVQEAWQQHIEVEDNVIPSANALCAHFFARLGTITGISKYSQWASDALHGIHEKVFRFGPNYSLWLSLSLHEAFGHHEMVICGPHAKASAEALAGAHYPALAQLFWSDHSRGEYIFKGRFQSDNTLFYWCQNNVCNLPITSATEALAQWKN